MNEATPNEFLPPGKRDRRETTPHTIDETAPVDYQPVYDEDALNRFAQAGAKAWADVPDAAQWVRELRGG